MRHIAWVAPVMLAMVFLGRPEALSSEASRGPSRLSPIVVGMDEIAKGKPKPAAPLPAPIEVDEKAKTVRVPVTFTQVRGAVEWLLVSGPKHVTASVLTTGCSSKALAEALARIGLADGVRPGLHTDRTAVRVQTSERTGADEVTPPQGMAVEIDVVLRTAEGRRMRIPASLFFSQVSGGEPVGRGKWVYVGQEVVSERDAKISITDLEGGLVATDLRSPSAMIYWVPDAADAGAPAPAPAARPCYASNFPLPREGEVRELIIRSAAVAEKPAEPAEPAEPSPSESPSE